MAYARKLTKKELQEAGITEITKDCKIFRGDKEFFPSWSCSKTDPYLILYIYDLDANGNKIKTDVTRTFKYTKKNGEVSASNPVNTYVYKTRSIGLHRAMWAWHYGEVPEGMVVDHIDNKHSTLYDYRLENLQLLTPKENVIKEKPNLNRIVKCCMTKPRIFYENKLAVYTEKYEKAKKDKNQKACHKLRSNISGTKARLKYWDEHKDEYEAYLKACESEIRIKEEKAKEKAINDALIAEAKAQRKADAELKKKLNAIATEYRLRGNKQQWHGFKGLLKNFDALPREKLEEITTKTITKLGI